MADLKKINPSIDIGGNTAPPPDDHAHPKRTIAPGHGKSEKTNPDCDKKNYKVGPPPLKAPFGIA